MTCRERRGDAVEAVRRLHDTAVEIKCLLLSDAKASGGDAQNMMKK
jgi:hypothetical protein